MRAELVTHYMSEFLSNYLATLARKFPKENLTTILQNYLWLPAEPPNSEVTRILVDTTELYNLIKAFEEFPDEYAYDTELAKNTPKFHFKDSSGETSSVKFVNFEGTKTAVKG